VVGFAPTFIWAFKFKAATAKNKRKIFFMIIMIYIMIIHKKGAKSKNVFKIKIQMVKKWT
jgi:hypothetical protein